MKCLLDLISKINCNNLFLDTSNIIINNLGSNSLALFNSLLKLILKFGCY